MARNPQRGHAKAMRRKKLLADRRKGGSDAVPQGRTAAARRDAKLPFHSCYVQAELFELGTGMVALARGSGHRLVLASFLVDSFCLGVKDATFGPIDAAELEAVIETFGGIVAMEPAEPAYARKLLRDAVAYARSIGFEPHRDFALADLLFGDISADDSTAEFQFGKDGKPLYAPGPTDSPREVHQRLEQLRRTLGEEGFSFVDEDLEDLDEEDFDALDFEDGYDAEIAPDAGAWLALDEEERLLRIMDYHEREGMDPPPSGERFHAAAHVLAENRIALGERSETAAIERLMSQGLDRHEAVHAIAAVSLDAIRQMTKRPKTASPEAAISAAVDQLTAESWRRDYGPEE